VKTNHRFEGLSPNALVPTWLRSVCTAIRPQFIRLKSKCVRHFVVLGAVVALLNIPLPLETIKAAASGTMDQQRRQRRQSSASKPSHDYSRFSHSTHVTAQRLSCAACHKFPTDNWKSVRKGDAAFPDVAEFPRHETCLNCHRTQFFARERPVPAICSNCHVKVTPRDTVRFLFPSLGDVTDESRPRRNFEREFAVNFPHETHLEIVSLINAKPSRDASLLAISFGRQNKPTPVNCPVCHQTYMPQGNASEEYVTKPPKNLGDAFWLKKGTFKTIPNSHAGCFTCHNADSGIAPTSADCQVCHKLKAQIASVKYDFDPSMITTMGISDGVVLDAWSRRMSAGAFRHEGGAHPDLVCTSCHLPSRMNTAEPQTLRVAVKSCGGADGCHVTATLDEGGSLNYEIDQRKSNAAFNCTKCHVAFGKQAVPVDHLQAIPAPTVPKKSAE